MTSPLIRVSPEFKRLAEHTAREWTVKTNRPVTTAQVTAAMARAFQKRGALNVTIVNAGRRPRGGMTAGERQFWAGFRFDEAWR